MEVWLSWTAVSLAVVTVYWLKLHYAAKHGVTSGRDVKRESETVAELQNAYQDLSDRIEQLNERLDFAERVLAEVLPEGKGRMRGDEFARGHRPEPGEPVG